MRKLGRSKDKFDTSLRNNKSSYIFYFNKLWEIAISMFEWKNLPETVDERYLEMSLFATGQAVFFKDDELGYLGLRNAGMGKLNVYGIPIERRAVGGNGYSKQLDIENSVIIFNNMLHTNTQLDVELFASKMWEIDQTLGVNIKAQKTPILITCDEPERLTMKNVYEKYDGNQPVIYGTKNLSVKGFQVLKTDAPFIAMQLQDLKNALWNEALSHLGISNVSVEKRERLLVDEVNRAQGAIQASRNSRLEMRKKACDEINRMFDLNIECVIREDLDSLINTTKKTIFGTENDGTDGEE